MDREILINNRKIGKEYPAYVIAEMSANHAGDYRRAEEIVYAAKEAGADCIKVQTYTADTLTIDCSNEYFHIQDGLWKNENLYRLYQKAYTPWEWQPKLKALADRIGIDFLSTPFDRTSVDFLEDMGLEFYKIASFELVDIPLIRYIASKKKPIILSTGMGTVEEIGEAVDAIREFHNHITLLKCASAYPAVTDEMNLMTIRDMRDRFGTEVGLSDHSMGSLGAVTAVALGASVIEKHFCMSRSIDNPDAAFSMEPVEFKQMVQDIRNVEKAMGTVSYGPTTQEMGNVAFRRSIFAVKDIRRGEMLTEDNIRVIRPGQGLKPKYYNEVLGKKAKTDIVFGTPLSWELLE